MHWLIYNPLWWPETGIGYAIGSSWAGATAIITGVIVFWHKHNCHEHRCLRLSWQPDSDGHPICKVHHSDHPRRKLSWEIKHFITTGHIGDHDHPRHSAFKKKQSLNQGE
jgi:hypothetical protein